MDWPLERWAWTGMGKGCSWNPAFLGETELRFPTSLAVCPRLEEHYEHCLCLRSKREGTNPTIRRTSARTSL